FGRELTVSAGSGGYTLRSPGLHRIRVSFRIGNQILWSNVGGLVIRPSRPRHREFADLHAVLARPQVARLLLRHHTKLHRADKEALASLARRHPRAASVAAIHYAVGRVLPRACRGRPRERARPRAERALKLAADHPAVGRHRRARAADLLDELSG